MHYGKITLLSIIIAVVAVLYAYILSDRLVIAKNKINALQAKKTALEMEIKSHNEKSLETNRQIKELKLKVEKGKRDNPDAYRCWDIRIPDNLLK